VLDDKIKLNHYNINYLFFQRFLPAFRALAVRSSGVSLELVALAPRLARSQPVILIDSQPARSIIASLIRNYTKQQLKNTNSLFESAIPKTSTPFSSPRGIIWVNTFSLGVIFSKSCVPTEPFLVAPIL